MTALEIRIIGYALAALALITGIATVVHRIDAHHYEALMDANRAAQQQALLDAQQKVIAAQAAQKQAEDTANAQTLARQQADSVSRTAVLDSVHNLETAVHSRLLPAAVVNPGAVQAAQPGALDPQRLAGLVERFNGSLERFIGACQRADEDRNAILSLEPKVIP